MLFDGVRSRDWPGWTDCLDKKGNLSLAILRILFWCLSGIINVILEAIREDVCSKAQCKNVLVEKVEQVEEMKEMEKTEAMEMKMMFRT